MKSRIKSHLLTKDNDALVLGRGNDVGQHLNTTTINKLQSTKWEINEDILHLLDDVLKDPDEPLNAFELAEREKGFNLRLKETDTVIDYLLENGNEFYFGWKVDTRGRMYSQGYHINPQGNEYRKAMLQFVAKEELTDEGIRYLKMDIANTMGYDKLTWLQRLSKANAIIEDVFASDTTMGLKIKLYAKHAGDPQLFIKAIYAYHKGVILGQPIGHDMYLDATASGIQVMSAMAGCSIGARHSNVHALVERTYTEEVAERLAELEAELASL